MVERLHTQHPESHADGGWERLLPNIDSNREFKTIEKRTTKDSIRIFHRMVGKRCDPKVYLHVAYTQSEAWLKELERLVDAYRGKRSVVRLSDGREFAGFPVIERREHVEAMDENGYYLRMIGIWNSEHAIFLHDFLDGVEMRRDDDDTAGRVRDILDAA